MIIAECENDQSLMHRLGIASDQIRHELGRSRALTRTDNWKKPLPVIGVVDEDPKAGKHPLMSNYELVKGSTKTISLKRKGKSDKWIIIVPSFFEDWLCKVAKRNSIKPSNFNLPDNPMELHKISFRKNENARRFLIELVRTEDNELLEFKEWLSLAVHY